ncbi:Band 7 protein CG42540 [Durusdinium trenchii]|uniref:Band 7 protein CG42540 n=1 Tax=Durusdinium trenchii TaxID=1381693 RepID=A0ABP0PDS3_9DINO
MNQNGSTTERRYELKPARLSPSSVEVFRDIQLLIQIVDSTMSPTFDPTKFGGLAALANGCKLRSSRNSGDLDLFGGKVLKDNSDILMLGEVSSLYAGVLTVSIQNLRGFELNLRGFELNAKENERLIFLVRDDLRTLGDFRILATFDKIVQTDGGEPAVRNMTGNYELGSKWFSLRPPLGSTYEIHHLRFVISTKLASDAVPLFHEYGYGTWSASALESKMEIIVKESNESGAPPGGNTYLELTKDIVVAYMIDWLDAGFEMLDQFAHQFSTPSKEPSAVLHLDCIKVFGAPIMLRGNRGGQLNVRTGANNFGGADSKINLTRRTYLMAAFKPVHHQKPRYIRQLLDDVGDQSGVKNFNGDYSLLPNYEARVVATPGRVFEIHTMHVWVSTVGVVAINRNGYGGAALGLFGSAGIRMFAAEKNAIGSYVNFLDMGGNATGISVIFHSDWLQLGAEMLDDIALRFASPSEGPWMIFRFDFKKLFGSPIVLRGNREGKLVVDVGGNNFTNVPENMDLFGALGSLLEWMGSLLPRWALVRSTEGAVVFHRKGERVISGPKIVWWLPCVSDMELCEVNRQTVELAPQTLMTKDGKTVIAGGVVVFKVVDVRVFLVDNYDATDALAEVAAFALRDAIVGKTMEEIQETDGRKKIDGRLTSFAQEALGIFGIEVEYMRLTDFSTARGRMTSLRRQFDLACCALCVKQEIPEVEAIIRLLQRPVRTHLEDLGSAILADIEERLSGFEERLGAPSVDLLAEAGEDRDELLATLLAGLLLTLDHAAVTPFPGRLERVLEAAVDRLLDQGAQSLQTRIEGPRRALIRQGAVNELRTLLQWTLLSRRNDAQALMELFLTSRAARRPAERLEAVRPLQDIDQPQNREEWLIVFASTLGTEASVQPRAAATLDQWAVRWYVAGQLEGLLTQDALTLRIIAFNNPPDGPDTKTTPFCRWVHGRTINLRRARAQIDRQIRLANAGDAEGLIENWPLLPSNVSRGREEEQEMAWTQFFRRAGLPPYHIGCRTVIQRQTR